MKLQNGQIVTFFAEETPKPWFTVEYFVNQIEREFTDYETFKENTVM